MPDRFHGGVQALFFEGGVVTGPMEAEAHAFGLLIGEVIKVGDPACRSGGLSNILPARHFDEYQMWAIDSDDGRGQ